MIFKSRQVNLDPEPWACYTIITRDGGKIFERAEVCRHVEEHEGDVHYEPRPEFELTRDPWPYLDGLGNRHREAVVSADPYYCTRWAPRREQFDTPVNRVLAGVREDWKGSDDFGHDLRAHAAMWLSTEGDWDATSEEREHARKVLTRLAAL